MTAPSLHRSSTRLSRRSLGLGAAVAAAGLVLTACGSSNALSSSSSSTPAAAGGAASSGGASGTKTRTGGGATFPERLGLQQRYGHLVAKNGYTISSKPVTDREVYGPALEQGQ